jgi:hypothetical protein
METSYTFMQPLTIDEVGRVLAVRRLGLSRNDQRNMVRISGKAKYFSFHQKVQTGCGPYQPPVHCVPRVLSQGVNRPALENDHSSPSSADSKTELSYISTPLHPFKPRNITSVILTSYSCTLSHLLS